MAETGHGEVSKSYITLDSSLESVDQAEEIVLKTARQLGFDEDDENAIAMAVREGVVNAVVHGNRYSAKKRVHLGLETAPGHIVITIGDEGEGFDLSSLPDPLAEENLMRQSGRGILLIQAFMDEFDLHPRLGGGTEVRIAKNLAGRS
jgi:serine/threonine-protein kinase RsbW